LLDTLDACGNQRLYFLGRIRAAAGKTAHLAGHHGKTPALLARTCRLDRRVQRQDIGLERNAINDANDVGNLAAALVDALHGFDHLSDRLTALLRDAGCAHGQLVGLAGVVGVLTHGAAQLLHGGRRFFQCAGLLLRPR